MTLSKYQQEISQKNYCTLCWEHNTEAEKKKVPVFACCAFGQSGFYSPENVCRNCLLAMVNQEIENIRTCPSDYYDDKEWLIPFEKDVIFQIAFEGLN